MYTSINAGIFAKPRINTAMIVIQGLLVVAHMIFMSSITLKPASKSVLLEKRSFNRTSVISPNAIPIYMAFTAAV
nr:hypothetical protein [Mucilaginibacter sp.]